MKEFNRIIALIEARGGRLSNNKRLELMAVALESAFDQLECDTQVRNACADMLKHQRSIWQHQERMSERCRAYNAQREKVA